MPKTISTKELRATLPKVVQSVKRGEQFTVLYRSRPVFRIVPIDETGPISCPLDKDPLYGAQALGRSSDGLDATNHDSVLYGTDRK